MTQTRTARRSTRTPRRGRTRTPGAWTRARNVLRSAFGDGEGEATRVEIGRVVKIGHGSYRDAYVTHVDFIPDPHKRSGRYAVLLPRENAPEDLDERTRREVSLLKRLAGRELPFRVPQGVAAVQDIDRLALVRRFRDGFTLDMRGERQRGLEPWVVIAEIAAAIHHLDLSDFQDLLHGPATRRAHAEEALRILEELDDPIAEEAMSWGRRNLPGDEPSVFLHGDLVGDNVLLMPEQRSLLIDWENARIGDPAYDLARVTRAARQPFKRDDGLQRLVDAYARKEGVPGVTAAHVRLHELCLAAGRCLRAREPWSKESPETGLEQMRDVLTRAQA